MHVFKEHKLAIRCTISNIKGISPSTFIENAKPIYQLQRRLNPPMIEVVKKKILKLLEVKVIYPILYSTWVSPTQVVPTKTGITMLKNPQSDELVTT